MLYPYLLQLLMLPQPPFKPVYYTLVIIDLCKVQSSAHDIADFFVIEEFCCFNTQISNFISCLMFSNIVVTQQALPGAFPAVVAGAVRTLFERIADLDMECRTRLILWFSHHLYVQNFSNCITSCIIQDNILCMFCLKCILSSPTLPFYLISLIQFVHSKKKTITHKILLSLQAKVAS